MKKLVCGLLLMVSVLHAQIPGTDIYSLQLDLNRFDTSVFLSAENLTQRAGYDNQASFDKKGRGFYYSSISDSVSDIYYYSLATRVSYNLSGTPYTAEYSPRISPYSGHLCFVRVEADGRTQNFYEKDLKTDSLYQIAGDGDTVGYYAFVDHDLYALFLLDSGSHNLYYYDAATDLLAKYYTGIGRCMQRHLSYFVFTDKNDTASYKVMYVDVEDRTQKPRMLTRLPGKAEDFVFVAKDKILCAWRNEIYLFNLTDNNWYLFGRFDPEQINNIKRPAYDTRSKRLLFCADDK